MDAVDGAYGYARGIVATGSGDYVCHASRFNHWAAHFNHWAAHFNGIREQAEHNGVQDGDNDAADEEPDVGASE
jgi:hypothetical protein